MPKARTSFAVPFLFSVSLAVAVGSLQRSGTTQVDWRTTKHSFAPPVRTQFAMAFDVRRSHFVLFGGVTRQETATWIYDDKWTVRRLRHAPSGRFACRLAYDIKRNRSVLYGGRQFGLALGDTWEWDGNAWQERKPKHSPGPRSHYSMAFDYTRGRTLLFGGDTGSRLSNEMWAYDGVDWMKIDSKNRPSARENATMCFDTHRRRIVLFGGSAGKHLGDTWEWDGVDWARVPTAVAPVARNSASMSYDRVRRRVVLFGGLASRGVMRDTWEWDGARWIERKPPHAPPATWSPVMGFDTKRGLSMMFGGSGVWTYQTTRLATKSTFGRGCGRTNAVPSLAVTRLPWIGSDFVVEATSYVRRASAVLILGTNRNRIGKLPLPLVIDPVRMPGCRLYTNPVGVRLAESFAGRARWEIPVADSRDLVGHTLYAQALVFDANANRRGIAVSNATAARIGER